MSPAWLARDERRRGKLIPGFVADLVVLDRDPFECEPEELRSVNVVATMCAGKWTHKAPPWD
jgi:predicted amidohydrolase YtcJ